jgi:hypothetical protein
MPVQESNAFSAASEGSAVKRRPGRPKAVKKDSADLVSQQSTCFDSHSLKEIENMPALQTASELRDFSELLRQEMKKERDEPVVAKPTGLVLNEA